MTGQAEQIRLLQQQLNKVENPKMNDPFPTITRNSLFRLKVLACPLPSRFRLPQVDLFDGSGNPCNHLETFCLHKHVQSYAHFNCKAVTVSQATDEAKLIALITGLQPSDFLKTLTRKAPTSFADAMARA